MNWDFIVQLAILAAVTALAVVCIGTGIAWILDGAGIICGEFWREVKRRKTGGHF